MEFCFPAPAQPSVPIADSSSRFPVRRIYCVGRNYAEHAREMGATGREPPFFFGKPADCILTTDAGPILIPYPDHTQDLQHEVELVVAIGSPGYAVPVAQAGGLIWGYAVGLDLTRRDLQTEAKRQARPWDTSKGFDGSAPISAIRPLHGAPSLDGRRIWLDVNGQRRQEGALSQMIWSVTETIAALSQYFRLAAGDLIFTGTPAGVGALQPGDELHGSVEGIATLTAQVVRP